MQVGVRFIVVWCCQLCGDLKGQDADRSRQGREMGDGWVQLFTDECVNRVMRMPPVADGQRDLRGPTFELVIRIVRGLTDPQLVEHDRELPSDGDHRALFRILPAAVRDRMAMPS